MAGNIGMMNEAYFLSKAVLLDWVNVFLQTNVEKVEQMATGACYCNLFDALHPRTIPMSKVDFSVKYDYEYAKNWKLLQNAFLKVGIKKQIPLERLTKGRYQDNLEFLQWFYKYAHDTYPGDCDNPEYDAVQTRMRSKGGKGFHLGKNHNRKGPSKRGGGGGGRNNGKENMSGANYRPPSAASGRRSAHSKNGGGNVASSVSMGSMRGYNNNSDGRHRGGAGQNNMRNNSMASMNGNRNGNGNSNSNNEYMLEELREENKNLLSNNDKLKKQVESLNGDHVELRAVAKDIEKERDFYFNKVLQVENICKQHGDQSLAVLKSIYDILYQNEESAEDGTGAAEASVPAPSAVDTQGGGQQAMGAASGNRAMANQFGENGNNMNDLNNLNGMDLNGINNMTKMEDGGMDCEANHENNGIGM